MIEVKDIAFSEGNIKVENLSFEIRAGEIFGVVGSLLPESQKAFRILSGVDWPQSGSISYQPYGDLKKVRALGKIGIYSRGSSLIPELTLRRNLTLINEMQGLSRISTLVDEIMSIFDLSHFADVKARALPSNVATKAAVAAIFVGSPDFLFLEDFTLTLDKESSNSVLNFLRSESGLGKCVCMLTDEPELMCQRVLMLRGPSGVIVDTPSSILQSTLGFDRVEVKVKGLGPNQAEAILTPIEGSWLYEAEDLAVIYIDNTEEALNHLFRNLMSVGARILSVTSKKPSFKLLLGPLYKGGER